MPVERISVFCFGASYTVALALELIQLVWPRKIQRILSMVFGAAGLLAHTLVLAYHPLNSQDGSLLFLAWILAVFYLYGTVHHGRFAWAVFVLPVVLGLIVLAELGPTEAATDHAWLGVFDPRRGEDFWRSMHGWLLELAAVGVCVGFVFSVMYLLQARRLKAKLPPGQGLRLLSLERLEEMNRRAINVAFVLLSAGIIVGVALLIHRGVSGWTDPKILGSVVLWAVFAILLYLRYGLHLRGRRVALLMITAFALLVLTLISAHTSVQGGGGPP